MKKYLFLTLVSFFVFSLYVDAKPPKRNEASKVDGKIKAGNKTGTHTVTIDLGIIKYSRTTIICDGDLTKHCYEKAGDPVCSGSAQNIACTTFEFEDGTGFGGHQHGVEVVVDYPDGGSETIVDMIFDTYYQF